MTRYPQTLINLQVSPEGKLAFYTDNVIKDATEQIRKTLGDRGRLVVRASGTEPLMRVMAEHEDQQTADRAAEDMAEVIRSRLGVK